MPVLNYYTSMTSAIEVKSGYLSSDGRYVISMPDQYEDFQSSITLIDVSTGAHKTILPPAGWNDGLRYAKLSADSSILFFSAYDKTNDQYQTFVKNLNTGVLQMGSANAAGEAGIFGTYGNYKLSGNGQYLFFSTKSNNIVGFDTNDKVDLFRKDLYTGEVVLVSGRSGGGLSDGDSFEPVTSENGRYVVFYSDARNLLPPLPDRNYENGSYYVKDMVTNELRYLDVNLYYRSKNGGTIKISNDGSKIAYSGEAINNAYSQVYVQDRESQAITRISNDDDVSLIGIGTDLMSNPYARKKSVNFLHSLSSDGTKVTMITLPKNVEGSAHILMQMDLLTKKMTVLNTPDYDIGNPTVSLDGSTLSSYYGAAGKDGKNTFSINTISVNGNGPISGDNKLYPSEPGEVLFGGGGNDDYYITSIGAQVKEEVNAGIDTITSFVENYELPENVENFKLGGHSYFRDKEYATIPKNGNGNDLSNVITGNSQANIIQAKGGEDVIYGGGGSDVINGGSGVDAVHFSGRYSDYRIKSENGAMLVSKSSSADSYDFSVKTVLQEVERIQFSDHALSSSADIKASQAYRIYQAAFDRKPDASGLGYWVKQIDNGSTLETVATSFMQSTEFKNMYGENPSNSVLVEKFYQNVLHRAPDAGGLNYWTSLLDTKQLSSPQVLASFSESPENKAALVGVLDAWFSFTPYG